MFSDRCRRLCLKGLRVELGGALNVLMRRPQRLSAEMILHLIDGPAEDKVQRRLIHQVFETKKPAVSMGL